MKNVFLVITSSSSKTSGWKEREQYVRDFYFGLDDHLKNIEVIYTTYNDIEYLVSDSKVTIRDSRHHIDLSTVSFVHFKNWMFNYEEAALIAFYLGTKGVRYANAEVDAGLAWGKISQMCRLAVANVAVPDTFFARRERLLALLETNALPDQFKFPIIMKADDGAKGNDNFLLHTTEEAVNVLRASEKDKQFVIQNFLPNDGDYRLLFMGFNEEPLVFVRTAAAGSHLNNTSKGGAGRFLEHSEIPKGFIPMARKAAKALKREISGVDIIVDKASGKSYVLEVNSTPALATGYGVDRKQERFAAYLKKLFNQGPDS